MKKTYLAKRNALLSPSGFSGGVLALIIIGLLVVCRFLLPGLFLTATMPFVRAGDSVSRSFGDALGGFGNRVALTVSNEHLTQQNEALAVENRTLADKIASLTALLGATSAPAAQPAVVAPVVARPPISPYDSLVISGGTDAGISDGMEVFGTGGVPIGVVSSVTNAFARVTLFTAPGESLAAWVGTAHVPLTISGVGAGAFTAEAPRSAGFTEGETVYAPGPGALPVGTIGSLTGAAASPTVTVHIVPATNPFSIAYVVLRDAGTSLTSALTCASSTAL